MLYGGGLRRAEAVALDFANYNAATGALLVRGRNKERTVFATNGAAEALPAWLAEPGSDAGPLFRPVNKAARIEHRRLTDQAIYDLLGRIAERAGVDAFSPHDMRGTFISDLLDAGADIATMSEMAGHAQITATARYDRPDERAKRRSSELLHVSFTLAKVQLLPGPRA